MPALVLHSAFPFGDQNGRIERAFYLSLVLLTSILLNPTGSRAQTQPTLPQLWVNDGECNPPGGVFDVVKTVKANGRGDYAYSQAGLNQAISDWVNSGVDQWERIAVDSNLTSSNQPLSGTTQIVIGNKLLGGNPATKCLVIQSDRDQ